MEKRTSTPLRRALVTGGAGFIGSHLTEQLLAEGLSVTVVDNLSVGSPGNVPPDAAFVQGDIRDFNLMQALARESHVIFHLAAKVSIRGSVDQCYEDTEANLLGTMNVLRACRGSGVKKLVFASSMAVYADSPSAAPVTEESAKQPIAPYGIAKLAAELYCLLLCKTFGIDCVVLRYFNTFGPRQTFTPYVGVITIFINRLLKGEPPVIFGDGNQLRDFVYVGDIVRASILAMQSSASGQVLNIGTGTATSVNRIAHILCAKINPGLSPRFAPEQTGDLRICFPDISRARDIIGYAPRWRIEDKIDEVIHYIRHNSDGGASGPP